MMSIMMDDPSALDLQNPGRSKAIRRLRQDRTQGELRMKHEITGPRVMSGQRQLMQYLRSGDWKIVASLPVVASEKMLKQITDYGWIERRSTGPRSEIKLTPAGLAAIQAPI
jgi:hypothetical protein